MSGYFTHQPVLFYILDINNKPILELGSGYGSTEKINKVSSEKKIKTVTIDHDQSWLNKFINLKTQYHEFLFIDENNIDEFYYKDNIQWGVVFVDIGSWESRNKAMMKYKDVADYVILHDCDYFPNNDFFGKTIEEIDILNKKPGKRTYDDVFKYWVEFFPKKENWHRTGPPTLLGSNFINVNNFVIPNIDIVNKSNFNF